MPNKVTDKPSRSELNKMAEIARKYYKEGRKQADIASDYNIRQGDVSRYLDLAEEFNVVDIRINTSFNNKLEDKLKEKFDHLQKIIIVPHMHVAVESVDPLLVQELGRECAQYLLSRVADRAKIGVSSGNAVEASISALGKLGEQGGSMPHSCVIRPLSSKMSLDVEGPTQAALIAQLVSALPHATGKALQLPSISLDAQGEKQVRAYRKNPQIQELLSEIESMNCYVMGIGFIDYEGEGRRIGQNRQHMSTHEFNTMILALGLLEILKTYDAVGEVLSQPFDTNGTFLIDKPELKYLKSITLTVPLDILAQHVHNKSALSIAVAGGVIKHAAIHAAIRAKIFNVLVTDSTTAEYVLTEEGVLLD